MKTDGVDSDYGSAVEIAECYAEDEQHRNELLSTAFEQSEKLLRQYWPAVEALFQQLLEHKHIEGEDTDRIIRQALYFS